MFTTAMYILLALAIVALIIWLIETQIPGVAEYKVAIRVVAVILLVIWLVYYFGPTIDRALTR